MKILVQHNDCKFINNLENLYHNHETLIVNIENNIYQIDQKINPDIYVLIAEKFGKEEEHFCRNNVSKKIFIYERFKSNINIDGIEIINDAEIPLLYNPNKFFDQHIDRDIEYSYFLDNEKEIPEKLREKLLPVKINNIKMFNNKHIDHPQNLGLLSEDDKCQILNRSKNYICNNMFYALEAILCGCKVLDLELNDININIQDYNTYSDFFENII